MNIKLIARYIGVALLFNAAFMFLSVIVSMINGFDSSFSPLLLSCLITTKIFDFCQKKRGCRVERGLCHYLFFVGVKFCFRNVALCFVGGSVYPSECLV